MTVSKQFSTVQPTEDNRLVQLAAQYDEVHAAKSEAERRLKELTAAIKIELTMAAPGADDIRLDTPDLVKPLRLYAVTSMRIDTTKLRADLPDVYAAYSKPSTAWRLEAVRS